jgi:CDP-glycerol glycerophosphotransferase (TagB/SpsB family)
LLSEKGHYEPKTLIITGQIRTDIIPLLVNQNVKELIKVPGDSKIVLFASQPQQDPELREKSALDVFSAVKDIPDLHLIVKLHPAEFNEFNYYNVLAERVGCKNYQLVLQVDLYLLILIADIVITCFSTVRAETVYFSKPLIILDHLKQDIQGYFREGIAFQATSEAELKDCILQLLGGQLTINESSYQKYISNYAYKIDGQVAERILKFIKDKSEI